MLPLRDTETGHTPERPTSLALLNAAKNLMTAAGLQKEFATGEFFNFVLQRSAERLIDYQDACLAGR
jgi:hypothetical protein